MCHAHQLAANAQHDAMESVTPVLNALQSSIDVATETVWEKRCLGPTCSGGKVR